MAKKIVKTGGKAIGPYSAAVWGGDLLFVSGQIPYNAQEDRMVTENIEAETHQVMKNVASVLETAGLTWNNVVKASIFISDMDNFSAINDVYKTYFDIEQAPARECVQVARLPKDVNVEISVIATK